MALKARRKKSVPNQSATTNRAKSNTRGLKMKSGKSKSMFAAGDGPGEKATGHGDSFPVVAIRASAGGLEEYFSCSASRYGMAFVLRRDCIRSECTIGAGGTDRLCKVNRQA
jgi:hypothetical protein